MCRDIFEHLVSPKSGSPLKQADGCLVNQDGSESFSIQEGIACLLSADTLDDSKKHEVNIFDSIYIKNVSYMRTCLFEKIMAKVKQVLPNSFDKSKRRSVVAEMGGGEGHWARYVKDHIPHSEVFVCDLSIETLKRAPLHLRRVCADIAGYIFENNSLDLVCFWISLHHLGTEDRINALAKAVEALDDRGILLIFEPNRTFSLRKIMLNTRLRKDVYIDEREEAIDFSGLSVILKNLGLKELGTYFMNPPYNLGYLKKLKHWFIYFLAVEFLYKIDKWLFNLILGDIFSAKQSWLKKYLSLYGCLIYKKETM